MIPGKRVLQLSSGATGGAHIDDIGNRHLILVWKYLWPSRQGNRPVRLPALVRVTRVNKYLAFPLAAASELLYTYIPALFIAHQTHT